MPDGQLWCPRCGLTQAEGDHTGCAQALELEPPRYCSFCRRRMRVQVVPGAWTAECVEHGVIEHSTWG
jgi:hypothetical protein